MEVNYNRFIDSRAGSLSTFSVNFSSNDGHFNYITTASTFWHTLSFHTKLSLCGHFTWSQQSTRRLQQCHCCCALLPRVKVGNFVAFGINSNNVAIFGNPSSAVACTVNLLKGLLGFKTCIFPLNCNIEQLNRPLSSLPSLLTWSGQAGSLPTALQRGCITGQRMSMPAMAAPSSSPLHIAPDNLATVAENMLCVVCQANPVVDKQQQPNPVHIQHQNKQPPPAIAREQLVRTVGSEYC